MTCRFLQLTSTSVGGRTVKENSCKCQHTAHFRYQNGPKWKGNCHNRCSMRLLVGLGTSLFYNCKLSESSELNISTILIFFLSTDFSQCVIVQFCPHTSCWPRHNIRECLSVHSIHCTDKNVASEAALLKAQFKRKKRQKAHQSMEDLWLLRDEG